MASKKIEEKIKEELQTQLEQIASEPEPDLSDMEKAQEMMRSEGKIHIQKMDDETKDYVHIAKIEPSVFDYEYVKQEFGGGKYRAISYTAKGRYDKCHTFNIDKRFKGKNLESMPLVSTNFSPNNSELGEVKELLKTLIQFQMQPRPQKDPMELALEIAKLMKPETSSQPQTETVVSQMIGMFKQGMEMGQMMNGDGGYWPVIEKIGVPALDLLGKVVSNGNSQRILDKAKQVTEGVTQSMSIFDQLIKFVPAVLKAAQSQTPTDGVVEEILDRVPPMFYESIYEEVLKPDFFERVVKAVPDTKNHEVWFKDFVEKMKESLAPEPEIVEGGK